MACRTHRRRRRRRRRKQRGGALYRRKPGLVDKIAEGVSMGLAGPAPTFATLGLKLLGQAAKGVKDNVDHYRRQRGRGLLSTLASAAKLGYKLGKDKKYKRMGALGATGHYKRHPRPWER